MSLRSRPTAATTKQASAVDSTGESSESPPESPKPLSSPPSLSQRLASQAFESTAHLANLLPTGTLLAFQFLTPIFTNNGSCDAATKPLTFVLLLVLAVSCFLACFTDSFKATDGRVYYGMATLKGMWLFDYPAAASGIPELSNYRLRFIDGVHAVLCVLVFGAVALRDKNVVSCFYPQPGHEVQEVLDIVPIGIGFLCSLLFVAFPTSRHGIGFPVTSSK